MNPKDPRVIAIAAVGLLVVLVGGLLVQNFRHGWPFSLHHGIAIAAPQSVVRARPEPAPVQPRAEIKLSPSQIDAIGVRMDMARRETISQPIRAVASVAPDESRVAHIHTRVSGWVEQLYVNTTGAQVRAGQPLAGIFSQELMSSQAEYLAARRFAATGPQSAVSEGARKRLEVFGMSQAEIRAIERTGRPQRLVTVTATRSGVVLNRGISAGTAVDPSTEIMTIADLSRVWVLAEITEADAPAVQVGTPAQLEFTGHAPVETRVEFVYPTLLDRTRTLQARFLVDNADGFFRPGTYGTAVLRVTPRDALTVPRDAVVDTGNAQHVFVVSDNTFIPRVVKLGARLAQRVEIVDGLKDGEAIVASGVFLIDSESRLRASGTSVGHNHGAGPDAKAAVPPAQTPSPGPPVAAQGGHSGHP